MRQGYTLFFTGGTALRDASREMARRRIETVHIVTPFDSGGSSAALRKAFNMPAVGDARNRILALAKDQRAPLTRLLASRLPADADDDFLRRKLDDFASGKQSLYLSCGEPCKQVAERLSAFRKAMPDGFNLKKASIGNIYLTSSYLEHGSTAPAFDELADMVEALGIVRTVTDSPGHMCAELNSGTLIVGQHRITGKETAPLSEPIKRIFLTTDAAHAKEEDIPASKDVLSLIAGASLIVYPVGSFYSSVLVNLLPTGIADAIADNPCPKVFVPNPGHDPETVEMSVADRVAALLEHMHPAQARADLLDYVLMDESWSYEGGIEKSRLESFSVRPVWADLGIRDNGTCHPAALLDALFDFS